MASSRQVLTIVAMDVVGSSQLSSDQQKARINTEIGSILKILAPKHGATVAKHNGDGFIVGGHDPVEMAELALEARHHFRTTNWKKLGFSSAPQVRVALNTGPVEIIGANEFSGRNVEVACRIEPIVDPDGVWCSGTTSQYLKEETDRIRVIDIGERDLSKNFGTLQLAALSWAHEGMSAAAGSNVDAHNESAPQRMRHRVGISVPGIKREFSDAERLAFCETTFAITREAFIDGLQFLEAQNPDIVKTNLRDVSATRFECSATVQGKTRARLSVWISDDGFRSTPEIRGSTNASMSNSSYNYSLSVADTGYQLVMHASFALRTDTETLTSERAAQLLWEEFTRQLN